MPLAKKKLFDLAKGFRDRSRNTIKAARRRVEKGLQYSTRDRKNKKREFRSLWITQINAGVRQFDLNYSVFMQGLNRSGIALNRKVLAELAINEPYSFKAICEAAKKSVPPDRFKRSHKVGGGIIPTNVLPPFMRKGQPVQPPIPIFVSKVATPSPPSSTPSTAPPKK